MISTPGHRVPDGGVQTRPSSYRLVNMSFRLSSSAKSRPTVLLVDDDPETSGLLTGLLAESGFRSLSASGGSEMDAVLAAQPVDLILLDIMLPGEDGLSICRRLRATSWIPIILLTALGAEVDRVVGLEVGADDYVTKPYSSRELVARIRAVLRRRGEAEDHQPQVLEAGPVRMDVERHVVTVSGQEVNLPLKEFDLLEYLLRNAGRVLTRAQLIDRVWGADYVGDTKTLDVHVKRLRSKIEPNPAEPRHLITVRGLGYKFEG